MRYLTLAAIVLAAAAPAYAQNPTTNTQTPPSVNSASGTVEPTNSLPPGAGNTVGERAGSAIGVTETAPAMPMGTAAMPSAVPAK